VAGRLETLIKDYPGTRHETEAMMKLAETYLEMKERFRAQQTLQKLIAEHPADSRRVEAEKLLASIR
jgi:FimV-like protein